MLLCTVNANHFYCAPKRLKYFFERMNVAFTTNASNHTSYGLCINSDTVTTDPRSSNHLVSIFVSNATCTLKAPVFEVVDKIFVRIY